MADTPFPLPRQTRESSILVGNGSAGPYGPSLYKIFDIEDVTIWTKASGETFFTDVTASCTVTKTNGDPYDTFSVTFWESIPASTEWYHSAKRVSERSVAVTRAGSIDAPQLEKELSKQATTLSEIRRDLGRTLQVEPGQPLPLVEPLADGHFSKWQDGQMVDGGSADDIINAQANAAIATAKAAAASSSADDASDSAQDAADSAAGVNLPSAGVSDVGKQLYVKTDHSGYVLAQQSFDTIALAEAVTIPTVLDRVTTLNRGTGDGGLDTDAVEIEWERVSSTPSHGRYFLDDNSAIFSIITRVPDLFQFGGTTNGSPSGANCDALQAGLSFCNERSLGTLEIPNGSFVFDAHPGKVSDYGKNVHIKGQGMNLTKVYKTFVEATDTLGLFHWEDGSPRLSGMTITAATGTSGGTAFSVIPVNTTQAPGFGRFEDLYITTGPLHGWSSPFMIDGTLNDTDPKGVRDMTLDQVFCFGSKYGVRIISVVNFSWVNGFIAGDTGAGAANGNLTLTGVDSGQYNNGMNINLVYCSGSLVLNGNNANGTIQAGHFGGISNTSSETNMLVIGNSTTPAQTNWPSSCRHISSFRQDDTIHGSATGVGTAGTTIAFGRTFAGAPSVQATCAVGYTAVGYSDVTTTGCKLYAAVSDTTIGWTASGILAD